MFKRIWSVVSVSGALLSAANAADTASPSSATSAASSGSTKIETVVVTAERKGEALLTTPVAVTAYTSESRNRVGIDTIQDYANFTPGMNYANIDRISIRGSGHLTFFLGNDPGVANYQDGFYSASSTPLFETPLFVDRTEILRGPQGTLYGRNSIGGAINTIHRGPTENFEGEVRAEGGNYGATRFEGYVSGPITDNIRFFAGASRDDERQGYLHNDGPGGTKAAKGETYYYAALDGNIGNDFTVDLRWQKAVWANSNGVGDLLANLVTPYNTADFFSTINFLVPNPQYGYGQPNPGVSNPYEIQNDYRNFGALHGDNLVSLRATWDLDSATLKYIAGFDSSTYSEGTDNDNTDRAGSFPSPLTGTRIFPQEIVIFQQPDEYYSNELDLTSNGGGRLQWIVGLFQYHQHLSQALDVSEPNQPELATLYPFSYISFGSPCFLNNACAIPNPSHDYIYYRTNLVSDSYAGFAQAEYQINDEFKVQTGLRYTIDRKAGREAEQYVLFDPDSFLTFFVGDKAYDLETASRSLSKKWSGISGTVDLDWTPTPDDFVYGRYSRGYLSGGFLLGTAADHPQASPEYVDAFEVGYKSSRFGALTFEADAYFNNYHGMQINLTQFDPISGHNQNDFVNLDSQAYGIELESIWQATENLQFILSYAYLNSSVTSGCDVATKQDCFVDSADPGATDQRAKPVLGIPSYSGATPGLGTSLGFSSAMQQVQTLKGDELPQSAPNKVAINGNYTWHFNPGSLTLSGTYVWQDMETLSVFNGSEYRQPAYSTADFRLLWKDATHGFTAIAFVKNAFNSVGYNSQSPTGPLPVYQGLPPGAATNNLQRTGYAIVRGLTNPRVFGIELQYPFSF